MVRTFRFSSVLLLALVALFAAAPQPAQAQVTLPFKIIGKGVAPDGLALTGFKHNFVGLATQLGLHVGQGQVQITGADGNPFNLDGSISGTFDSATPCVFIGGHGDKLVCNYGKATGPVRPGAPGTFKLTPLGTPGPGQPYVAEFMAEFVPTSASTGKFAGVTGSFVMVATTVPFLLLDTKPVLYCWQGEGRLTYKKQ